MNRTSGSLLLGLCSTLQVGLAAILFTGCRGQDAVGRHDIATVPMTIEGNRPFVELEVGCQDGRSRRGRFWIDSGGGGFVLTEEFANRIGLPWEPATVHDGGGQFGRAKEEPHVRLAHMSLQVLVEEVFIALGSTNLLPQHAPGHADGLIPRTVLARYHLVLNYREGTLTLALPGRLTPRGVPLKMPVSEHRFPYTELTVGGKPYGLLLDTGASFSVISEAIVREWSRSLSGLERYSGAHGDAKTLGGSAIDTLILPEVRWGPFLIGQVGFVSRQEGTFEKHIAALMQRPTVGALGGNVLKSFRIELDYANQTLYLSRP